MSTDNDLTMVLAILTGTDAPMTAEAVWSECEIPYGYIRDALDRAEAAGLVTRQLREDWRFCYYLNEEHDTRGPETVRRMEA